MYLNCCVQVRNFRHKAKRFFCQYGYVFICFQLHFAHRERLHGSRLFELYYSKGLEFSNSVILALLFTVHSHAGYRNS